MADEKDLETPAQPEAQNEPAGQEPVAEAPKPEESGPDAAVAGAEESAPAAQEPPEGATPEDATPEEAAPTSDPEADMMAMLEDLPEDEQKADVDDINFSQTSVSKAEFQQLSEPAGETEGRNIELLMDVNLPISIELGRTKMSIADILSLGPGSVVELNKLAGEPVDLLVNQKIVAKGEVVVIDENFGVRITQLMTPEERLKSLGDDS
ncbi:MAG: flagellar motor switch protein FliN [Candidatus Zixiibacteriota bacterium]|nr:MAG: flagellar motor switch protein FliN [candidate division Zixibacteria bacterium]